jgi:hypothetical protein
MAPQQKTVNVGQLFLAGSAMSFEKALKFAKITQVRNPGMRRQVAFVSKISGKFIYQ